MYFFTRRFTYLLYHKGVFAASVFFKKSQKIHFFFCSCFTEKDLGTKWHFLHATIQTVAQRKAVEDCADSTGLT